MILILDYLQCDKMLIKSFNFLRPNPRDIHTILSFNRMRPLAEKPNVFRESILSFSLQDYAMTLKYKDRRHPYWLMIKKLDN